jgi:hypothetical protein
LTVGYYKVLFCILIFDKELKKVAKKKDIEIVSAGHTCLDLIPAFTIEGKVDKMTDVLVPSLSAAGR